MAMITARLAIVMATVGVETTAMRVDDCEGGANGCDSNHEPEKGAAKRHRMGELYRYIGASVKKGRALAVAP